MQEKIECLRFIEYTPRRGRRKAVKPTHDENGVSLSVDDPKRIGMIINYLNAKEADEMRAGFFRQDKLMAITIKNGHEVRTKTGGSVPHHGFR